jgi:glycine hydroxymethyltransferase
MTIDKSANDYLVRGTLADIDPDVAELIRHETAHQARYLVMIASESTVPEAVREALSSSFHNIYAEGYPLESSRTLTEEEILDYDARLAEYRRSSNERYYKGAEYVDIIESLARRRIGEVFAANGYQPEQLYVNVQPLSGAPANSAVYTALVNVGDTVMGMDLIQGGHLTHGSPVNRSGKFFNIVSYGVNADGQVDYDQMYELAQIHKPKMIIGGFSSFPFQADWAKYREIADSVGAYLMADIAHVAGLVAGGVYPSPVGIADVVTFTTHKSFAGPRGAVIITHRKDLSSKIDRGVFPGEQGGPHVNQMAALCVAAKLAKTDEYRQLQQQTLLNASRLTEKLADRGFKIAYGGTNTHLLNLDLTNIIGEDGTSLSGEAAAVLLDLVGIVANRQTVPGDTSPLRPSGIRLGTPWITQRGFKFEEIDKLADIIADLLFATKPYSLQGKRRAIAKAKVPFEVLHDCRIRVRELALSVGIDTDAVADDYPHFSYLDSLNNDEALAFAVKGEKAGLFLQYALTSDVASLSVGESQSTALHLANGERLSFGTVAKVSDREYTLTLQQNGGTASAWLRSLSDGYVLSDLDDPSGRLPGPIVVKLIGGVDQITVDETSAYALNKTYFIGQKAVVQGDGLPAFTWEEPAQAELLTTPLHNIHAEFGAKFAPFAGYDMPLWYSSVSDEHLAVRQGAGVFDVTHMGVLEFSGAGAVEFLDGVTTNDVYGLAVGDSHYTFFLGVDGVPLDDLMIYRLAEDHFLVVVNASNNDKNWAWLYAIKAGTVLIDPANPSRQLRSDFTMRDLRALEAGADRRVDIALQGVKSLDILLDLARTEADHSAIKRLGWANITRANLHGFDDVIVSRTGYTGERVAYELFVHPDQAEALFRRVVEMGAVPCGLAARDSLRTEAGLPLYGQELAGDLRLDPADAGFGLYVKAWKPFFIGKSAFIARNANRDAQIARFQLENKRGRPPHAGDPIVDDKGKVVGIVTSCSIDTDGYQVGQVYIKNEYAKEGVTLGIFAGSGRIKPSTPADAKLGGKVNVPETVVILSRYPRRKK